MRTTAKGWKAANQHMQRVRRRVDEHNTAVDSGVGQVVAFLGDRAAYR